MKAGFTEHEVEILSEGRDPSGKDQPPINLNSPAWRIVIDSRQRWRDGLYDEGLNTFDIENLITDYYKSYSDANPWDLIKAEYRDPSNASFKEAQRKRAQARVRRLYRW